MTIVEDIELCIRLIATDEDESLHQCAGRSIRQACPSEHSKKETERVVESVRRVIACRRYGILVLSAGMPVWRLAVWLLCRTQFRKHCALFASEVEINRISVTGTDQV